MRKYDIIIIGGGPGGYVAAIRAAQLGNKVAVVESNALGGICCNWGCIPTKTLLNNAHLLNTIKDAKNFGIDIPEYKINWDKIIDRSRNIVKRLSKGIEYLMNKNKIDVIQGRGELIDINKIKIHTSTDSYEIVGSKYIIIATGARPKVIEGLKPDGTQIITYKEAMVLKSIPKSLTIIGAGAIGIEFADLYNSFGTKINIIEAMPNILPIEDIEISQELEKIFKKRKINILTDTKVDHIEKLKTKVKIHLMNNNIIESEKVLVAVGVQGNIESIGLDKIGIDVDNTYIKTNGYMQTNIPNIYAIGDIAGPPLLAHVASAEAIIATEHISKLDVEPMEYDNIPGCTYSDPEVASVGLTELEAKDKGFNIKIGKFPFSALGKSLATGHHDGFVKVIYDAKYGEMLGCHIIGSEATNLITEPAIARKLETTYYELIKTIHPHPTLSEAIMEATADAYEEAIHI